MPGYRIWIGCLSLAFALGAAEGTGAAQRQPVPDAELQKEAEALIRDFFKDGYADTKTDGRIALARRLIREAAETNTDMELKFVLLREAALKAGHIELAMEAIDRTGRIFEYDAFEKKTELLKDLADKAQAPAVSMVVADAIMALIGQCVDGKRYAEVADLARMAAATAEKSEDTHFVAKVRWLVGAYEKLVAALSALSRDPTDPAANLKVGRYYCFYRNAWDRGLPMLARSEDETLRSLARAELNGPDGPAEQYELAQDWRRYAKGLDEQRGLVVWEHAVVWYREALQGIEDEDDRLEIKERIAAFFKAAKKSGYAPRHVGSAVPAPPPARPPASAPGNEEAGLYLLKCTGGKAKRQIMTMFRATGTWTDNDQLWWTGGKPGDVLSLGLRAPAKGRYAVRAILTKSIDYGIVQFYMKGEKLGGPHDGYSPQVTNTPWVTLGVVKLGEGRHVLTVKIVGSNPKSKPRYFFGIDELKLKPVE